MHRSRSVLVQNQNSRKKALLYLCSLAIAFAAPLKTFAQESVPTTRSYIKLGEDFLHALYPDLNDKKYTITVETSFRYDDPTDVPRVFTLDVGTGPKSFVLSCCFGGYVGGTLSFKIPDPTEWPPPPPPPCPPAPSCPLYATPRYPMRPKNVDSEGRLRPEQFLTGNFSFDVQGRLVGFNGQGSALANYEAENQIYEALRTGRHLTDAEITKILKDAGARFGFKDQKQFRDQLPIRQIERFIGKVELLSLDFDPIGSGWNDDPVSELGVWTNAVVLMRATQKDGTQITYKAFFNHFAGALTGIGEWSDPPNKTKP
jgi:hypothetical protein